MGLLVCPLDGAGLDTAEVVLEEDLRASGSKVRAMAVPGGAMEGAES